MTNYLTKALEWTKKHPVATAVGAVAASALVHTSMNTGGDHSYMRLHPESRFVPYLMSSLACAEMNVQRVRKEKGRNLTPYETATSYLYGAIAPTIAWESWEQIGATDAFYHLLHGAFGDRAQQEFVGKGSFIDLWGTTTATMGLEAVKHGIKNGVEYVRQRRKSGKK